MKRYLLFVLISFSTVVIGQTIDAGLLQRVSHNDESATDTPTIFLSRGDITGTPQEGSLFYDNITKNVYIYTDAGWSRLYMAPKILEITANYTLTEADDGNVIRAKSTTPITLTIPSNLPVGFNVSVYQTDTGNVTIMAQNGVDLLNRLSCFVTAGKDAGAGIISTQLNTFHITGDLTN